MLKDNLNRRNTRKYDENSVLVRTDKIRLDIGTLSSSSGVESRQIVHHLNHDVTLSPTHIKAIDGILSSFGTSMAIIQAGSDSLGELGDIREINNYYQEYRQLPAEMIKPSNLISYVPRNGDKKVDRWMTVSSIGEDPNDIRYVRISVVGGGLSYFSIPKNALVHVAVLRNQN